MRLRKRKKAKKKRKNNPSDSNVQTPHIHFLIPIVLEPEIHIPINLSGFQTSICKNLIKVIDVIQLTKSSSQITQQYGQTINTLGFTRLNLVYFLANVIQLDSDEIYQAFSKTEVFSVLVELIKQYKVNNMLRV